MDKMTAFGEVPASVMEKVNPKTGAYGIDLGTTNSCIAFVVSGNTPKVIELDNGKKTMPSCVMWKGKPGQFVVGQEAYKNRYKQNTIYSVKRLMGSGETVTLKYGTKELTMTPAEVSAEILKELVRQASEQHKDIKDVIITVPAYFDNKQIGDTLEAGKLAGLNVLATLTEPTSASLVYENKSSDKAEEKILVYDLGGGTFDTSLLRITRSESLGDLADIYDIDDKGSKQDTVLYTVIDTDGDSRLGGDDLDREMYKLLERKIAASGHDISKIPDADREKLILKMEQIKKMGPGTYGINVDIKLKNKTGRVKEIIQMDYSDFAEATRAIYGKTRGKVKSVLGRVDESSISSIVLVGGSTKSPLIQEFLKKDFPGVQLNSALNPDESVALGAAVKAKAQKFGDKNVEVFDIIPMSIGVLSDGYVKPIIRKNQRVPYSELQIFSTVVDNQERVEVHVYQGNSPIKEECLYLGTVVVKDIPKKKAREVAVRIRLTIDTNGMLKCLVDTDTSSKEVELVNLFGGNEERKVLSVEDRRAAKWRAFAEKLEVQARKEVLAIIDKYSRKGASLSEVGAVISKYSGKTSEVVKPTITNTDIHSGWDE